MSASLPGAGGGHTADSELEEAIATLEWVIACVPNLDRFTKGKAALARLEQTIDGLRRERSSLEAAANRTAATVIGADEFEAARNDPKWLAFCQEADAYVSATEAAEAERDAAHAALREIADLVEQGEPTVSELSRIARAVLGGPENTT